MVSEAQFDLFLMLAGWSGATMLFSVAVALPVTTALALACRHRAIRTVRSAILAGGGGLTASALTWVLVLPARPGPPYPMVDNLAMLAVSAVVAGCIGGWAVARFSRVEEPRGA
jgi:hypothetical protein